MPMQTSDYYHGPARGTAAQAIAAARPRGATRGYDRFVREIYRVAPQLIHPRYRYGLDPAIAVAESSEETAVWTSPLWKADWNPAGIGITADGVPSPFVRALADPEEAARLFLYHVWIHLHGTSVPIPGPLTDVAGLDTHAPKVLRLTRDPKRPLVQRLRDLCLPYEDSTGEAQCTWACDPAYAVHIVAHAGVLFGALPDQPGDLMTPLGRVPPPPIQKRLITTKRVGHGRDPDAQRTPKFSVVHSMVGTLLGTDDWFRRDDVEALTDFGIGLYNDTDGDGYADIYQWNDPYGRTIGWASGPVEIPFGDGPRALAAFGGPAGVNRYGVSIELDDAGTIATPVTAAQWSSLCWLLAYWHDRMGQTAATFDWNLHHREFTGTAYKDCPFARVYLFTDAYQAVVKAIMRFYQEGVPYPAAGMTINGRVIKLPTAGRIPTTPTIPAPSTGGKPVVYPEGMDEGLARAWFGRGKGKVDGKQRSYGFDPSGSVSKAWLAYVAATGHAPALKTVEQYGDRMYWRFDNGLVLWRANPKTKVQVLGT